MSRNVSLQWHISTKFHKSPSISVRRTDGETYTGSFMRVLFVDTAYRTHAKRPGTSKSKRRFWVLLCERNCVASWRNSVAAANCVAGNVPGTQHRRTIPPVMPACSPQIPRRRSTVSVLATDFVLQVMSVVPVAVWTQLAASCAEGIQFVAICWHLVTLLANVCPCVSSLSVFVRRQCCWLNRVNRLNDVCCLVSTKVTMR